MNDELRERRVEDTVGVRERIRRSTSNVDAGMTATRGSDERFGRIDSRYRPSSKPIDQLGGEGARTASDIQHPVA